MNEVRRAFTTASVLALLVVGLLTACNVTSPPEQTQSPAPAAETPAVSGRSPIATPTYSVEATHAVTPTPEGVPQGGAVTIGIATDVPDLKPWDPRSRSEEIVAALMYNGLVQLDARLQPQPDLAEVWDTSPDGGLITFTLRSDLRWHDGEPLTINDVTWTLNMLRTITPTNSLLFDLRQIVGEVRSPLEHTVVLSLTQPYAPLLSELAVPILPRHRLQNRTPEQLADMNFWNEPVGSGPFKFDQRTPDQSILFTSNEAYFHGQPNLDQVALVVAPDPGVATDALRDGRLLVSEFAPDMQPFNGTSPAGVRGGAYPENGWYGIVFNMRPERFFADARLREALSRAVNVPEIVAAVTNNGQPIATTLSPVSWAYHADFAVPPFDVEEANRLLEEAGFGIGDGGVRVRGGTRLEMRLWVRGDDPRRVEAARRIAAAAEGIGMRLEVTPANFDTVILAKLAPPYDFDLLLGSWVNAPNSAGFPTNHFYDPDDFALFHSSRIWQGQGDLRTGLRNVGGFASADYDRAAEEARHIYDPEERAQAIQQAQHVLLQERPYLLLWADRIPVFISDRIQSEDGTISLDTPRYLWDVEQWYLER